MIHYRYRKLLRPIQLAAFGVLAACNQSEPFPGLVGPRDVSRVAESDDPAVLKQAVFRDESELGLFVVDPMSNWGDLENALRATGLPVRIVTEWQEAKKHRTVLLYPTLSGRTLDQATLEQLRRYVREGGHLLATAVEGRVLNDVFGFNEAVPARTRMEIVFQPPACDVRRVVLGDKQARDPIGTYAFQGAKKALASFEDGSAAITQNEFGAGLAEAVGIDLGYLAYLAASSRDERIPRPVVNAFTPVLDSFLCWMKKTYLARDPKAFVVSPVPEGKEIAVLITHDVDFARSVPNSIPYAKMEAELGVRATYFMQTKYIRDYNDEAFYDQQAVSVLKQLRSMGMEVGSHSVSHSTQFHHFPLGDGKESYPAYAPFVSNAASTQNGTVLGELRVSKFLLDHLLSQTTVSFRSGGLFDPEVLPQALEATGFLFDSSETANHSLTHLPIQLTRSRRGKSRVSVYRFPVTIEDEEAPPMLERLERANSVCESVAALRGICVILVHPNETGTKLEFVRRFIVRWKGRAWFGTVEEFGQFWTARDRLRFRRRENVLELDAPLQADGIVLQSATGQLLPLARGTAKTRSLPGK